MANETAASPPTAPDGPDDFDAAMHEAATIADEGPAPAAADESNQAPPSQSAGSSPPAHEAGGHSPSAGDPAPVGAPSDIWASVPDEVREFRQRAEHTIASMQGRVRALQRELQQRETQPQPLNPQTDGQQQGDSASISPELQRLQEEYPELAAPIVSELNGLREAIRAMQPPIEAIRQEVDQRDIQQRIDVLAEQHPDWQTLSTDERWGDFLAAQPRAVQEAHDRNVDLSDPQEAAWVLGLFKNWAGITPAQAPNGNPQPSHNPRRQRQLDANRDGGSSGYGAATTGTPDDFDAALNILSNQYDQAATARR